MSDSTAGLSFQSSQKKAMALKPEHKKTLNWIADAVKHKGGLHESLGVPQGQKIPESKVQAAAKKGGKVGKQARLAETLEGLHH